MSFELLWGLIHLMADAAGVAVAQLVDDLFGARWPALLHVPVERLLSLEGLVAAKALQRSLPVEPLA